MVLRLDPETLPKTEAGLVAILGKRGDPLGARIGAARALQLRPSDTGLAALGKVVADADEALRLRVAATLALAHFPAERAEPLLIEAARAPEARIARNALRSLGRIGGGKGMASALRVAAEPRATVEAAARFAATLIAYRHRLARPDLAPPRDGLRTLTLAPAAATPIEVRRMDPDEGARAIAQVMEDPIDVELDSAACFEDICGGLRRLIAFARAFSGPDGPEALARAPAVLGVVGRWSNDAKRYASDQTLLATPGDGGPGGFLHVIDGRGEILHFGTYRGSGFEIAAVDRPGASAMAMAGRYRDGKIVLETGACVARSLNQRQPQPFVFAR